MSEKKHRSRKKIYLACIGVLLLAAVIGGAFTFRIVLQHRLQDFQQDILQKNQANFRTDAVKNLGLGKFELLNPELGPSNGVLFAAPRAELTLNTADAVRFSQPQIKQLEFFDSELNISRQQQILLNGIPLQDFVQKICELPADTDGDGIPLKINCQVRIGGGAPSSRLVLEIAYRNSNRQLNINGQFESLSNPQQQGAWQVCVDYNAMQATVATQGHVNLHILQEILLHCRLPKQLVSLFHSGGISGDGQFSAVWPSMEISDFKFQGSAENAVFDWYTNKINAAEKVDFLLEADQLAARWKVPELKIQSQKNIHLKDLVLDYQKKQPNVKFSAAWDLTYAMTNFFCGRLAHHGFDFSAVNTDRVEGNWNLRTGDWQFSGKRQQDKTSGLGVSSANQLNLHLTTDNLQFQAEGVRNRGKLTYQLEFSNLTLQSPAGKNNVCHSDKGTVFAKLHFGERSKLVSDTLEFNFKTFSLDGPCGNIEIPNLAGEFNLRRTGKQQQDLFIICRGGKSSYVSGQASAELGSWQCTFTAESSDAGNIWNFSGINLDIPQIKITRDKTPLEMSGFSLRGSGKTDFRKIITAQINLKAAAFKQAGMILTTPAAAVDYDALAADGNLYEVLFQCAQAEFAGTLPLLQSLRNAELKFAGKSLHQLPEKSTLKAQKITVAPDDFTLDFANSNWEIARIDQHKWQTDCQFESLSGQSRQNKFGSGSFGNGSLKIDFAPDGSRLAIKGKLHHPAWRYGDLHLGGEELNGEYHFQTGAQPLIHVSHTISNANILGKYFTAVTPLLSNKFSADSPDRITGKLDFQSGTVSSISGDLELQKTLIQLPWQITGENMDKLESGMISAENLAYRGADEGAFSGSITHLMNPLLSQHTLKVSGKLAAEKFGKKNIAIQGTLQLPPSGNGMLWQLDMPETELQQPLPLKNYLPLPLDISLLKGSAAFNCRLEQHEDKPTAGKIKYSVVNSDWQIVDVTAEGVSDSAEITVSNNHYTIMPHSLSIGKLLWRKWVLAENDLNLALNENWQLIVSGWQGRIFDGKFRLSIPLTADLVKPAPDGIAMQFEAENVAADQFFKQLNLGFIESRAKLSGTVRSRLDNGKVYFDSSTLSTATPAGELLKLTPPAPETLKVRDPQYRAFALAVLSAMNCYSSQFDFSLLPGEVSVKIQADGVPAAPVPFVYQGRNGNSPFRPATPGERGFDGEVELNLNLKYHPSDPGV